MGLLKTIKFGANDKDIKLTEDEKWIVVSQLHSVLQPFLFRREKSEVASELPEKKELVIPVEMSAWQKAMYRMMEENWAYVTE